MVRTWDQEVCFLCGLRFELCGCLYDGHWRLTWSLTLEPVRLVEICTNGSRHQHQTKKKKKHNTLSLSITFTFFLPWLLVFGIWIWLVVTARVQLLMWKILIFFLAVLLIIVVLNYVFLYMNSSIFNFYYFSLNFLILLL